MKYAYQNKEFSLQIMEVLSYSLSLPNCLRQSYADENELNLSEVAGGLNHCSRRMSFSLSPTIALLTDETFARNSAILRVCLP